MKRLAYFAPLFFFLLIPFCLAEQGITVSVRVESVPLVQDVAKPLLLTSFMGSGIILTRNLFAGIGTPWEKLVVAFIGAAIIISISLVGVNMVLGM